MTTDSTVSTVVDYCSCTKQVAQPQLLLFAVLAVNSLDLHRQVEIAICLDTFTLSLRDDKQTTTLAHHDHPTNMLPRGSVMGGPEYLGFQKNGITTNCACQPGLSPKFL